MWTISPYRPPSCSPWNTGWAWTGYAMRFFTTIYARLITICAMTIRKGWKSPVVTSGKYSMNTRICLMWYSWLTRLIWVWMSQHIRCTGECQTILMCRPIERLFVRLLHVKQVIHCGAVSMDGQKPDVGRPVWGLCEVRIPNSMHTWTTMPGTQTWCYTSVMTGHVRIQRHNRMTL